MKDGTQKGHQLAKHVIAIIKKERRDLDMNQSDLAKRCNRTQGYVSKFENGNTRGTMAAASDMCDALGLSFSTVVASAGLAAHMERQQQRNAET